MRFRAFQAKIRWTHCRGCHCLCLHQGQGHNSKYVRTNVCVLNKNSNYRLDGNQTSLIDNSGTKEVRKTNCTSLSLDISIIIIKLVEKKGLKL